MKHNGSQRECVFRSLQWGTRFGSLFYPGSTADLKLWKGFPEATGLLTDEKEGLLAISLSDPATPWFLLLCIAMKG